LVADGALVPLGALLDFRSLTFSSSALNSDAN
jgi:hypothetical protein